MQKIPLAVKRINRMEVEGNLRAFCDLAVADAILIKGVRVVEGKKGLFVSMPREQGKNGQWYGTVIPLTKEAYQQINEAVLEAYAQGGEESQVSSQDVS